MLEGVGGDVVDHGMGSRQRVNLAARGNGLVIVLLQQFTFARRVRVWALAGSAELALSNRVSARPMFRSAIASLARLTNAGAK